MFALFSSSPSTKVAIIPPTLTQMAVGSPIRAIWYLFKAAYLPLNDSTYSPPKSLCPDPLNLPPTPHCIPRFLILKHGTDTSGTATCAIVEMAKKGPIDLSSLPPTCDHCAIGKQLRSLVPKAHEGVKVNKQLERVHVDLWGLMAVTSCSGKLYSMNQIWHKAVTVQSGDNLWILVTNNRELVSHFYAWLVPNQQHQSSINGPLDIHPKWKSGMPT